MAAEGSASFTDEQVEELCETFKTLDTDGSGFLDVSELRQALEIVGLKLPQWQVRKILSDWDTDTSGPDKGTLSFKEFKNMCSSLKAKDIATTFKKMVNKRENLETIGGMSTASSEGTTHSVRLEEQLAFSDWINSNLGHDPDLQHLLPIDPEGKYLYDKVKDGILLCKMVNFSCPDTIDERAINKRSLTVYTKHENLTLALSSAQAIGCNVVNIDAHDLAKGKPHLVLGLLWQIIRIGLFNQISLEHCPGLAQLLQEGEDIAELMKLSPEAILLRWVNHHLDRAGVNRRCNNFTSDVKDSEIYSHLLKQIAPNDAGVTMEAMSTGDMISRAELMLQQADKLGCRSFLTPQDVVEGVYKLNVAFVANLFNNHPALDKPDDVDLEAYEHIEESREEKTYRNWMNSMGVNPHVNWLYSDLADGIIIFQLYDIIRPGIVDWKRVHSKFSKLKKFMEKLENCNYAVELGLKLRFSLVGIAGHDLADGNPTLTLALIWQLMRAYTLSMLSQLAESGSPIVEAEIISWVNTKLSGAGKKSSIRSFQDSSVANALAIVDLVDAIKPGTINYDLMRMGGGEVRKGDEVGFQDSSVANALAIVDLVDAIKPGTINYDLMRMGGGEDNLANAKYAISMARKIGARIYALPEDITEVKPKMVMTVFACLMARDYLPNMDSRQ